MKSLSVVIATWNGSAHLGPCLDSLARQEFSPLETIVVDNGSTDGSADVAHARGATVLRNDLNLGFAVANNQGVEAAHGEFVLFLNDDTVVEPGALRSLVEALEAHEDWGACQPKLLLMEDPTRLDTAGSFLTTTGFLVHRGVFGPDRPEFDREEEIFAAKGAALLCRRDLLAEVGAFDADFFAYFEETDLCWRIWLAGWRVGYVPSARVLHKLGSTAATLPRPFVFYHSFKNRICSLLKNLGPRRLAFTLPLHVVLCLGVSLGLAVRGRGSDAAAVLRAIAWNVRELPTTLRKRRRTQLMRKVSDAELRPRIIRRASAATLVRYFLGRAGS